MNKEDYFIKQFHIKNSLLDDGAYIDNYVYSKDAFFENIHFQTSWLTLYQVAQKAMLVNISDAIVMNAKPIYALLSVAIPAYYTRAQLLELASGFKDIANKYNIQIIGGDTLSNTKLDITITIISKTTKPIFRKGLKNNNLLAYTGTLGSVKKDLKKVLSNKSIYSKSKLIKPTLHDKFYYDIAKYITISIDISDGLGYELERVSKINRKGFKFYKQLSNNLLCSGEEYEILFAFNPKYKIIIQNIAKKYRVKLNIFSSVKRGSFKSNCINHHFS